VSDLYSPTMDTLRVVSSPNAGHPDGHWPPGPLRPRLADTTVHVWRVDLAAHAGRFDELLSEPERERAADSVRAPGRRLWSTSRGVLRTLLGRYLQLDPRSLRFAMGTHGKPALVSGQPGHPALRFSLSHSGPIALYAFAAGEEVGVDIQAGDRPRDGARAAERRLSVAKSAFGEDAARELRTLRAGEREREFLRRWTRYEAELKCRGTGIRDSLESDPATLWAINLEVGAGAVATLACAEPPHHLHQWEWA
jgi:4'-phosphopantetheinyl transferase